MNKKILIIASKARSLINFRYQLIKALLKNGYQVIACAPGDEDVVKISEILGALGVEFIIIDLKNTGLSVFYDIRTIFHLYKIIKNENPGLVLSYTIKPVIYGSVAAKLAKVERIYSMITGLGYVFIEEGLKLKILRTIIKKLYTFALKFNQKVFFQNRDDLELFVDNKIVINSQIVLISGSGVDLNYYKPCAFPNRCTFLLIARLLKNKGICEYVKAAKMLKQFYPETRFILVGSYDANPDAINETELKQWVSMGFIEYFGKVSDVRPMLAVSSVFVLPSYREGMPHAVLEAMASGRPIITTDAPGCRETTIDGVNGFLVPVRDVEKTAKAMEKFILRPELILMMGKKSRQIAEEKYDVNKVNKVILEAINSD